MTRHPYGGQAVGENMVGRFRRALVVAIFAALVVVPAGFADSVTIAPEADTFVRASDGPRRSSRDRSTSTREGPATAADQDPAFGLLRFDLDAHPSTGASSLTAATGWAVHRASPASRDERLPCATERGVRSRTPARGARRCRWTRPGERLGVGFTAIHRVAELGDTTPNVWAPLNAVGGSARGQALGWSYRNLQ